jgi:uncharacterized protein
MKLLLISDSHGFTHNIIKAITLNPDVDMIIHLGDFLHDILSVAKSYKALKFEYVPGNNDWSSYPKEKVIDVEGSRILITHGHLYGVKQGYNGLISLAESNQANAVFFGHTHLPDEIYSDHLLLLNPGSIGLPTGNNRPTYCIVEISGGKLRTRFKHL